MKLVNGIWYVKFRGVWLLGGRTIKEAFYYLDRLKEEFK